MRAIDVFTGVITPEFAAAKIASGCILLIQNCWTGGLASNAAVKAVAESNLRTWRLAGGLTAIYTNAAPPWVYSWGVTNPAFWVQETLANAGSEFQYIIGVVIDYEISDTVNGKTIVISRADMLEFIRLLKATGKPVGTYSGDWFVGFMKIIYGNAADVQFGLPYWYALYNGIAVVKPTEVVHPMGPVKAKQYGSTDVQDDSIFDDDFFGQVTTPASTPQEDDMTLTPEQANALQILGAPFADPLGRVGADGKIRVWGSFIEYLQAFCGSMDQYGHFSGARPSGEVPVSVPASATAFGRIEESLKLLTPSTAIDYDVLAKKIADLLRGTL
jgi:hypothetical protein